MTKAKAKAKANANANDRRLLVSLLALPPAAGVIVP